MIGCHDRDQVLQVTRQAKSARESSLAYRYLIKHGHFPLNRIKNYVLDWDSKVSHPRLLATRQDLTKFRSRPLDQSLAKRASRFVEQPTTLTVQALSDAVASYFSSRHSTTHLAQGWLRMAKN